MQIRVTDIVGGGKDVVDVNDFPSFLWLNVRTFGGGGGHEINCF